MVWDSLSNLDDRLVILAGFDRIKYNLHVPILNQSIERSECWYITFFNKNENLSNKR